jgi:hypothetical protein
MNRFRLMLDPAVHDRNAGAARGGPCALGAVVVAVLLLAGGPSAAAGVASPPARGVGSLVVGRTPASGAAVCAARSAGQVIRTYRRGAARLVLRCGSTTWGYRHVAHRWSPAFDAKIALTLARGVVVTDYQQDGGSAIYALFDSRCHELFRVVYNGGAYRGLALRPQGVITAYARPSLVMAAARVADRAGQRSDCRVMQEI